MTPTLKRSLQMAFGREEGAITIWLYGTLVVPMVHNLGKELTMGKDRSV